MWQTGQTATNSIVVAFPKRLTEWLWNVERTSEAPYAVHLDGRTEPRIANNCLKVAR